MTTAEIQREQLNREINLWQWVKEAMPPTTRILQIIGLVLLTACLGLATLIYSEALTTRAQREESLTIRHNMLLQLQQINTKLDSTLSYTHEATRWHYEGQIRSMVIKSTLDSLKKKQ